MALDFVAGCLGGGTGVLVGHPFDTVKVRLQTQSVTNPLYKGTFDCFRSIIKKESVQGLFKGCSSPLYGLTAINAIVFGVQGNVQRRLSNPDSLSSHFIGGATAGCVQSFICSPMELAKTRMQIQGQGESRKDYKCTKHLYEGPIDCLRKVYHNEGVPGVFRGLWLTILRETPSYGSYFVTFEYLCKRLTPEEAGGEEGEASTLVMMLAGGMAGIAAWIVTYPFDVLKSRIQADGISGTKQYSGIMDCLVKSYRAEGLMVLTRGLSSTLLRAFPVNAATLTVVTHFLRFTRSENNDIYEEFPNTITGLSTPVLPTMTLYAEKY